MKSVIVLIRTGDVWAERAFSGDQQVASLVLPGFAVRVADLWVDVDMDDGAGNEDNDGTNG
jgi:hypothetical protein